MRDGNVCMAEEKPPIAMSHDIFRDAREDGEDAERWRRRPQLNEKELRERGAKLFVAHPNSPIVSAYVEGARHILSQIDR
jgi:hypothetical protein